MAEGKLRKYYQITPAGRTYFGRQKERLIELAAEASAPKRSASADLGAVVEVADAQELLRQAETDDALARLGIRHAWLALAVAKGNLADLLHRPAGRKP